MADEKIRQGVCIHEVPLSHACERCTVMGWPRETQTIEPRAIIRHFAAAMERKLAANDAVKGGWREINYIYLMDGLNRELDELYHALAMWRQATEMSQPTRTELTQDVLDECADVANYAMLVADVVGALPPTDERGR